MNKRSKTVKYLLPAVDLDMGGFIVKQPLPTQKVQQLDPFLLLHHARTKYSENKLAKHQGVGPHPHRGFSPVTFVVEGEVHHRDSWGNSQIAKKGDIQWLHAGAGIVHSERPTQELIDKNGIQEIVQLWINSPASKKMIPPEYHFLPEELMDKFSSKDEKIINKLISGTYINKKSSLIPQSALLVIWGKAEQSGTQKITIPKAFNSMLYLINGKMHLKGYGRVEKENLVIFDIEGEYVEMTFNENSQFILLAGIPINEKVSQHGPYVMNSQTEVLQAMRDYQMGKMGILIEE